MHKYSCRRDSLGIRADGTRMRGGTSLCRIKIANLSHCAKTAETPMDLELFRHAFGDLNAHYLQLQTHHFTGQRSFVMLSRTRNQIAYDNVYVSPTRLISPCKMHISFSLMNDTTNLHKHLSFTVIQV